MASHLAATHQRRRWAPLGVAVCVVLAVFGLVDTDLATEPALDHAAEPPATSSPTVLGATITAPSHALPAGTATLGQSGGAPTLARARSDRPPRPTKADPPTTSTTPTTTTVPPPSIGAAWTVENTTTTTESPTTTTEPVTTTTEPTTTTTP